MHSAASTQEFLTHSSYLTRLGQIQAKSARPSPSLPGSEFESVSELRRNFAALVAFGSTIFPRSHTRTVNFYATRRVSPAPFIGAMLLTAAWLGTKPNPMKRGVALLLCGASLVVYLSAQQGVTVPSTLA